MTTINLLDGRKAEVDLTYTYGEVNRGGTLRPTTTTTLTVAFSDAAGNFTEGDSVQTAVTCEGRFCRADERQLAVVQLFNIDTAAAEGDRANYRLCRTDRRRVFEVVCPQHFRNLPERVEQRERALYARLGLKFAPPRRVTKTRGASKRVARPVATKVVSPRTVKVKPAKAAPAVAAVN